MAFRGVWSSLEMAHSMHTLTQHVAGLFLASSSSSSTTALNRITSSGGRGSLGFVPLASFPPCYVFQAWVAFTQAVYIFATRRVCREQALGWRGRSWPPSSPSSPVLSLSSSCSGGRSPPSREDDRCSYLGYGSSESIVATKAIEGFPG